MAGSDSPFALSADRALIAGGTSGVGLASAEALARAGTKRIVLLGRNEERGRAAQELVAALGADVLFLPVDVHDTAQVERAVARAAEFMGGIDVLLVSTAADGRLAPLEQFDVEEIERTLLTMAMPAMRLSRLVLPIMKEGGGGAIICVSADAAKVPTPGETVAGAASAAIVMFVRTLAQEVKRYGIRANVLTPSLIMGTGVTDRLFEQEFSKKIFDRIAAKASLGVPTAEDLAGTVVFLASPAAARVTGQAISVNGGISAG